ncbi:MAG TPA: 2-isopropylmalate synthase, partial [Gammaproteobacteria bacterium]|nr:2-isopropylmalate synthase [Gammaproteobacteria bacterium]
AKALEKLKVDVIEAGFPISSPGDFKAVHAIAKVIKESSVCGLARALSADIDSAAEALKPARLMRIHTFIATSPIHMRHKLQLQPEEVIQRAIKAIQRARLYTHDVEFSTEDAGRSEIDFLCEIIEQAIDAGATTINIPDTVGYTLPDQYGNLIKELRQRIPNSDKAIFSTHCHNDLGLAVANSLAGVLNGARQVECTINGLGERAGNASLEEVVMAVKVRKDRFACDTRLNTQQLVACSKLVSSITGFIVPPNKAIVGINAFAHEAGIHQDGVLKSRETYEIMCAQDVGWTSNRMVLGKHSGRNAFKTRCQDLGMEFNSEEEVNQVFQKFKELADKKHEIFDEDLLNLFPSRENTIPPLIRLIHLELQSKLHQKPHVNITLDINGEHKQASASGTGPVDAAFRAIETIMQSGSILQQYSVNAVHPGAEAEGTATIRLEKAGKIVNGKSTNVCLVTASAHAYVNALNLLENKSEL